MYIAVLAYKTWIKLRHVADTDDSTREKMNKYCSYRLDPALPRSNLLDFGGKLSIEEYRRGFCGIVPPTTMINETSPLLNIRNMAVLPFIDTDSDVSSKALVNDVDRRKGAVTGTVRIESNHGEKFNNSFCNRLKKAKLNPALMVRKKKMDTSNTLVSSMGIEIKKRLA